MYARACTDSMCRVSSPSSSVAETRLDSIPSVRDILHHRHAVSFSHPCPGFIDDSVTSEPITYTPVDK